MKYITLSFAVKDTSDIDSQDKNYLRYLIVNMIAEHKRGYPAIRDQELLEHIITEPF